MRHYLIYFSHWLSIKWSFSLITLINMNFYCIFLCRLFVFSAIFIVDANNGVIRLKENDSIYDIGQTVIYRCAGFWFLPIFLYSFISFINSIMFRRYFIFLYVGNLLPEIWRNMRWMVINFSWKKCLSLCI